mmetsp:Transcript_23388/g.69632  ORF Transcript_23388/g.69632 Transcript_23388/m.69632 type:complete len:319 (+) Transcript_23388:530-1486(+)
MLRQLPCSHAHAAPHVLHGVLRDQRDHRVRRDAHVVGGEAGPQTRDAALLHLLHRAVDGTLERHLTRDRVRLGLLHLRLDEVEGQREEGSEEAGNRRGAEGERGTLDAHVRELVLRQRVEAKHAEVQGHGARGGRRGALEEATHALLLHDGRERVADTSVVAALRHGRHRVRLHADQGEISRVADHGSNAARAQRTDRGLPEGHLLARHRSSRRELVVEAEARTGVEDLARQAGVQALVEPDEAILLDQVRGNGEGVRGTALSGAQLDAHLDHVHGLDARRRDAPGHAARHEGLAGLPHLGHDVERRMGVLATLGLCS